MKAKKIIGVFVLAIILVGVLYAQNGAALKSGVYKFSGIQGAGNIVIKASNNTGTSKQVVVHNIDGSVLCRGTGRITGNRMNVDYGDDGFETFTILDETSFMDNNGFTWLWVRAWKQADL